MKRTSKAGLISSIVIFGVLLVVLNVVTFAVPLPCYDKAVMYTAYGTAEFMILAEAVLVITQLTMGKQEHKILGLPIVWSGFIGMVAQVILTFIFYLVNAFVVMPMWIVVVLEVLLLCYFIIQITLGFFFKQRSIEYKENLENTQFMDEFRARLKAIVGINHDENITRPLEDLYDMARGSDSVTNKKSAPTEDELISKVNDLDSAIKNGNESEALNQIQTIKDLLIERNEMCKAGK